MQSVERVACVSRSASMRDVILKMTEHPQGAACIVDERHVLEGIITDGDIRRHLLHYDNISQVMAHEIMTIKPLYVTEDMLVLDAVNIMENRSSQISVLPVLSIDSNQLKGLLRIHDVYQNH